MSHKTKTSNLKTARGKFARLFKEYNDREVYISEPQKTSSGQYMIEVSIGVHHPEREKLYKEIRTAFINAGFDYSAAIIGHCKGYFFHW